jgi:hypothetical protein
VVNIVDKIPEVRPNWYTFAAKQNLLIMTKKLLLIAASLVTLGLSAQHSVQKNPLKQASMALPSTLEAAKTLTGQTCDSIVTMNLQTATITVAGAGTDSTVPSCTAIAGYVYGTNCYDDKEKAEYFDGPTWYGSVPNLSITAVQVMFWRETSLGMGTQGGSSANVGMRFYAGNLASGPTGAAFGATLNTMANVLASAPTPTTDFFFHQFNYATPIPVPASGFYASVLLPTPNVGDTAVIVSQDTPPSNFVWERFDDNSWHPVTQPSISWGAPGNMLVIAKYCFDITTGVSKNLGISNNVDVYPNPSTGIVKIQTTFLDKQDVDITITNMLGQVVSTTKKTTNIELLTVDLSKEKNGVYFVTVSTATDKMVTRLVINK